MSEDGEMRTGRGGGHRGVGKETDNAPLVPWHPKRNRPSHSGSPVPQFRTAHRKGGSGGRESGAEWRRTCHWAGGASGAAEAPRGAVAPGLRPGQRLREGVQLRLHAGVRHRVKQLLRCGEGGADGIPHRSLVRPTKKGAELHSNVRHRELPHDTGCRSRRSFYGHCVRQKMVVGGICAA